MAQLEDRVALVTGGGTGIGRAIAIDLAAAGAKVIICGRRREPLEETVAAIEGQGGNASATTVDMTDPDSIDQLGTRVTGEHGAVDILVNNAGYSSKIRSARYIGADEWRSVMDVNTLGPAMLTRALLPAMIERRRGHVVMISSMAAISPSVMAGAVYSAAKSAARIYMQTLAAEVRPHNIRCTTVFPGEVETAILKNRALPPDQATLALIMQPEDISAAVLMAVCLPERAMVSEMAIGATVPRDMTADVAAAMTKQKAN